MDLNTVAEIKRVHSRESGIQWSEGDAWLAGGTWLFSEPQPAVRRLIDLDAFGWPALLASELPVAALRKRTAFRRMALTHLGRSTALLIATMNDNDLLRFSITAATRRPVTIEFACLPKAGELRARLIESIPDALYFDDVHGTPEYRRHITGYLAEQIRQEFERGVRL